MSVRRLAGAAASILLAALTLCGQEARAASLPDWAKAVAASAPDPGDREAPTSWRVVFKETHYQLLPDGTARVRERSVRQALSDHVERALGAFTFDGRSKLTRTRAWHLPGDGERVERKKLGSAIDIGAGDGSFLSDDRARVIGIGKASRGSLAFFEFESTRTRETLTDSFLVGEFAPILEERIVIEVPSGWSVRHEWVGVRGPDPVVEGNRRTWTMRDVPHHVDLDFGARLIEAAAQLFVAFDPPEGMNVVPVHLRDWADAGRWYGGFVRSQMSTEGAVARFAEGVVRSDGSSRDRRVIDATTAVRDRVRYVLVTLGDGGYVPKPAVETAESLWGDCKAKSTLLASVLAIDEIASYPLFVNIGSRRSLPVGVPSIGVFDHVVLAVPIASPEKLAPHERGALIEAPDLGTLLVVDPTDEHRSPGELHPLLSGAKGLLVTPAGAHLITMPEARPEEHRYRARLEGVVLPGAGFRVQLELRYLGEPARAARANARAGLSDRVQALQSEIRETWTGAAFDEHAVNEDVDTGEFVETISWMAARLPGAGGSIPLFFIPSAWVPEPSLSQRSQPVIFDFPYSIDATSVWTGVPHGMVFDTPVDRAIDGASARVEAIAKGGELHANVSITMARRRFEAEAMRDLRRFYAGARAARSFTARVP